MRAWQLTGPEKARRESVENVGPICGPFCAEVESRSSPSACQNRHKTGAVFLYLQETEGLFAGAPSRPATGCDSTLPVKWRCAVVSRASPYICLGASKSETDLSRTPLAQLQTFSGGECAALVHFDGQDGIAAQGGGKRQQFGQQIAAVASIQNEGTVGLNKLAQFAHARGRSAVGRQDRRIFQHDGTPMEEGCGTAW